MFSERSLNPQILEDLEDEAQFIVDLLTRVAARMYDSETAYYRIGIIKSRASREGTLLLLEQFIAQKMPSPDQQPPSS